VVSLSVIESCKHLNESARFPVNTATGKLNDAFLTENAVRVYCHNLSNWTVQISGLVRTSSTDSGNDIQVITSITKEFQKPYHISSDFIFILGGENC
jgi:hypothetical protein